MNKNWEIEQTEKEISRLRNRVYALERQEKEAVEKLPSNPIHYILVYGFIFVFIGQMKISSILSEKERVEGAITRLEIKLGSLYND